MIDFSEPSLDRPVQAQVFDQTRKRRDSTDARMEGVLPTDSCRTEGMMSVESYMTILEDLLLRLQINVAVSDIEALLWS